VAVLLETLRALRSSPPLRNDLIFLFTDGEEPGLLGAKAFVDAHPAAAALVLNFEARGTSGPAFMFETSEGNGWIVRQFAEAAPYPQANSLSYKAYRNMPNDTDLTIFKKAGIAGLNFAFIGDVPITTRAGRRERRLSAGRQLHLHVAAAVRYCGAGISERPGGGVGVRHSRPPAGGANDRSTVRGYDDAPGGTASPLHRAAARAADFASRAHRPAAQVVAARRTPARPRGSAATCMPIPGLCPPP
jgi:hypothetical protein